MAIDNNDARFEAVHNAVPNLITLAAYRKIHFQSESPFSVRFTWMHKHATKTLTKKMALEMLDKSAGYRNPRMIDQQKCPACLRSSAPPAPPFGRPTTTASEPYVSACARVRST